MRISLILLFILQITNGYLMNTNMKLESNKNIARKECLKLLGTSLLSLPTKTNAITKCDLNLIIEHNKNNKLHKTIDSLEFMLVYQYILIFTVIILLFHH